MFCHIVDMIHNGRHDQRQRSVNISLWRMSRKKPPERKQSYQDLNGHLWFIFMQKKNLFRYWILNGHRQYPHAIEQKQNT